MLKGSMRGLTSLALAAFLAVGIAGCGDDGDDGATGPSGPSGPSGPTGPSGPAGTPYTPPVASVTSVDAIAATVTGVTTVGVSGSGNLQQRVTFKLADRSGKPLQGLLPADIRFTSAKLIPAAAGSGKSSKWKSYIYNAANQATSETGTAGTLVDNKDGTYTYTFAKNLGPLTGELAYDATKTHRVALQLGKGINNAAYTWQPSTGATTGIFSREIVDNDTCNACHDVLFFHGGTPDAGGRRDTQYCVTCHNDDVVDPDTSNSVDMKVLIHKIHAGAELTNGYTIIGYQGSVHDYSGIEWTQDIRNCQTCHEESDADTPQASNYRLVPHIEACGTCHDAVDFATGAGHGAVGPATNADCAFCHGPDSTLFGGALKPENAHRIPAVEAAKKIQYQIVKVEGVKLDGSAGAVAGKVSPGEYALATIKVVDPTNANTPYDILDGLTTVDNQSNPWSPKTRPGLSNLNPSLRLDVVWSTKEFLNFGTTLETATMAAQPALINFVQNTAASASVCVGGAGVGCPPQALGYPTKNADGSFTKAAYVPVPATGVTGSGAAHFEGRPALDTNPYEPLPEAGEVNNENLRVVSIGVDFPITDATGQARRNVVDVTKCNDCHNVLSLHGGNRHGSVELCSTCHNPDAVCDIGTATEGNVDLKVIAHGWHNKTFNQCGQNSTTLTFTYPGRLNNCEGCHVENGFYPADATKVYATSIRAGALRGDPTDDTNITPNLAVCSNCHTSSLANAHMKQNGASDTAVQAKDGTYTLGAIETCSLCHGPGQSADLRVMHKIDQFLYND